MTPLMLTMRGTMKLLKTVVFCMWPITVLAAGESLGTTFGSISVADWITFFLLAFFSGLAALLRRVQQSLEFAALVAAGKAGDEKYAQIIDWRVFAVVHQSGALFTAFLFFLVCEGFDINSYFEAAVIASAGWSGAKIADKLADGLSDGVVSKVNALLGNKGVQ